MQLTRIPSRATSLARPVVNLSKGSLRGGVVHIFVRTSSRGEADEMLMSAPTTLAMRWHGLVVTVPTIRMSKWRSRRFRASLRNCEVASMYRSDGASLGRMGGANIASCRCWMMSTRWS